LTVAARESVDLHGTVWARKGFVQSGAPLAKGRYMINMGDRRSETLGYTDAEATWVDVT
jgi:succinate dehydrogenase/fumarate reductase flavoprotein subunit